jgi:hypothetical protein
LKEEIENKIRASNPEGSGKQASEKEASGYSCVEKINREKVLVSIDDLNQLVDNINSLLKNDKLLKFIEASYYTDDNSNLIQIAEIRANEMSNSRETWIFKGFLWMSSKPYRFGIALYQKL